MNYKVTILWNLQVCDCDDLIISIYFLSVFWLVLHTLLYRVCIQFHSAKRAYQLIKVWSSNSIDQSLIIFASSRDLLKTWSTAMGTVSCWLVHFLSTLQLFIASPNWVSYNPRLADCDSIYCFAKFINFYNFIRFASDRRTVFASFQWKILAVLSCKFPKKLELSLLSGSQGLNSLRLWLKINVWIAC